MGLLGVAGLSTEHSSPLLVLQPFTFSLTGPLCRSQLRREQSDRAEAESAFCLCRVQIW